MYRILNMSSALQPIGHRLRELRLARGMTQQQLATAVGISRTTLVQIEQGKDAQASNLAAVAHALDAPLGLLSESPDLALRRQARANQQAKLAVSREKHLKIAVLLALGGEPAKEILKQARAMVALWRARELCSPTYIEQWQRILEAAPQQVAHNLLSMDESWAPALRQNTPFATAPA